jgi:inner membrane protein
MDTLTHALSGALVARVIAARRAPAMPLPPAGPAVGRLSAPWDGEPGAPAPWQCVIVGFVAGAFPDSDVVTQWFGAVAYLTHHRGLTHSVVMLPLWAGLVAWLMAWCFTVTRTQRSGWKSLYLVALGAIAVHIAGDWITQFGTMLLQPLSRERFGLGAMFIIDLVFSGLLLGALLLAALWPRRRWPAVLGLAAAAAWVGVAWVGQQEALAAGERHARSLGLTAPVVDVMPRPASPFNWTVSVFDGERYHLAHLNTRRTAPLTATADSNFVRRLSAPYQPEALATWQVVPRFGGADTPGWVVQAWQHEAFAFYRWFARTPALLKAHDGVDAQGRRERCAWFRDLRFEFPGREEAPFRFGVCLLGSDADALPARVYRLEDGVRVPV